MNTSNAIVTDIWEESRQRLRRFIAKRIDDPNDVDDVLQDVFLKIHLNIDKLTDPSKLYPWVFQTTRNAIADFYRARQRTDLLADEDLDTFAVTENDSVAEEEVLGWLEPMIADLPEKYREALRLVDVNGLTQQEVSDRLAISLSGAKSRVQRGREKLRDSLQKCCHIEFSRSGKIVEYKQKVEVCGTCNN